MNKYVETYIASVSNTAAEVSDAGSTIHGFRLENNHTSAVYVQLFNARVADVTLGTTAPTVSFLLPASGSTQIEPRAFLYYFNKGISIACTATRTGSGSPTAAASVSLWFSKN